MISSEISYRCHNCGQGWKFTQTDVVNNHVPKAGLACPICGTRTCLKATSVMATHEALCFKSTGAPEQLITIIYQLWRTATEPAERFIDYLKDTLDKG